MPSSSRVRWPPASLTLIKSHHVIPDPYTTTTMSNVFYQPDTIYVHSHEISVLDDWPSPVRELVDTLQLGRDDMIPGPSTTERPESELLADLTRLALQVSRGLLSLGGLWQKSDTIPKTMFLYPFIAEALNVIWPQEKINLDAPFALCIDPCHFQDPNARFKAPYLCVDVILTTALPILASKRPESLLSTLRSSSDVLSAKDEDDIEGTLASTTDKGQGSVSRGFPRSCFSYGNLLYDRPAVNEGSGSQYSLASSLASSLKVLPSNPNVSPHAQLLLQQREGCVEFPLVCVAPVATIYHVIASSLLQRHTLGISDPIVGLAINRYSTILYLVLGWYTPSADGSCVEVHVAHSHYMSAEPERSQQGVFDVSDLADAHNLLWKLRLLSRSIASLAAKAQNVFRQKEFHSKTNQLQWRLDYAGECLLDDPSSLRSKVEAWRMRCARRFDSLTDLDGSWMSDVSRTSDASLSSTSNSSSFSTNLLPEKSTPPKSARSDRTELGPQEKLLKTVERTCNSSTPIFKNLLQGDERKYATVLHFGVGHPVSASKYAATSPSPYLMNLAPCEIMQRSRRVIIVPWPLRSTGAPMAVLKPLQDIMHYFQWVKIGESGSTTKYPQIQDEYLSLQKMDESYRSFETLSGLCPKLANAPPSLSSTELDDILRDFQTNFDFVVEESDSALHLDWSTAIEAEGRVHGWDTIILRILEGDPNQETFVRFEQDVRTPRNTLVDIPDSADQFIEQANILRLSLAAQTASTNPMVKAAKSASAKSLQPQHTFFAEDMIFSANAYKHGVNLFLSHDSESLTFWEGNASRSALLSRYTEEPAVAKCDVISGVRVKDVFSFEDKDRSKRFSVISEVSPSPSSPVTWSSLHDTRTVDSKTSNTNPFLAFGVPDYKQVLTAWLEKAEKSMKMKENAEGPSEHRSFQDSHVSSGNISSHPSLGNLSEVTNTSSTIRTADEIDEAFLSLVLAIFFAEHKRQWSKGWSVQSIYQGHLYLSAGIRLLGVLGIYEFPIFCLVTDGKLGIILSGWGVEPEVEGDSMNIIIADHNPPRFDISRPIEALQFSLFLLHLRHVHAPKLRAKFDAVRTEFAKRWDACDPSLDWTLLHQRQEPIREYVDFLKQRDDEFQLAIAAVAALTAADSKTKAGSKKRAAPDTSEETGSASKKMKSEGSKSTRSSGPVAS